MAAIITLTLMGLAFALLLFSAHKAFDIEYGLKESACTKQCKAEEGACTGCGRTMEEIAEAGKKPESVARNLDNLILLVEGWAIERDLLDEVGIGDPVKVNAQLLKFFGEAGEMAEAVSKGQREKFKGEFGDVLVTLILVAALQNTTFEECLEIAYEKISKRTGKTINGVFVKAEDLQPIHPQQTDWVNHTEEKM